MKTNILKKTRSDNSISVCSKVFRAGGVDTYMCPVYCIRIIDRSPLNMPGYLFLAVMSVVTAYVLSIINTPSLLTLRLTSPPHRLRRHGRDGLTSLADFDQSCLVSILLIPTGQRYVNNGMVGMT